MKVFNCFNYFKKPSEKWLDDLLRKLGIFKDDKHFVILKADLRKLILRKSNEEKFSTFFSDYSDEIYEKVTIEFNQRDLALSKKNSEIREVRAELDKERNKNLSAFVTEVFSKNIFGIIDEPSLKIVKCLKNGSMDTKSIQKRVKLSHGEFFWRMDYLTRLGLVTPRYTNNKTFYQLSNNFQRIFLTKEDFYEKVSQRDIVEDLSRKAVGGDKHGAKKLISWLRGNGRKKHKDILRKLKKKYRDPSKVSQAFFGLREMGTSHEKHIGVRIVDHQSSGELLFLGIQ